MAAIKTITKYSYKGKEYNSLKELKDHIHNVIGEEVLDKINRVCPPEQHKNLFKMLDVLCSPEVRKVLLECYNVTFLQEDGEGYNTETVETNILDYK